LAQDHNQEVAKQLGIRAKLTLAQEKLKQALKTDYWKSLKGTIGADPLTAS